MHAVRLRSLLVLLLFSLLLCAAGPATAQEQSAQHPAEHIAHDLPPEGFTTTRHSVTVRSERIDYTAHAGFVHVQAPLPDSNQQATGSFFVTRYEMRGLDADEKAERPVTFCFNGGPGASSVYLHMGAMGPRVVRFGDDGTILPPPGKLMDNPDTWLAFTDLIFIDPVGTGYSRAKAGQGPDDRTDAERAFFGVREDVTTMAALIRRLLDVTDRWGSPRYLCGESYGGYRGAALASELQSLRYSVGLSGVILVSPALDFALLEGGEVSVLPWAGLLPTYAAAARHWGKGGLTDEAAAEYARTDLLTGLAAGASMDEAARTTFYERLASTIGLPQELVRRHRGRVPPSVFTKELLADRGLLVGAYDITLTAPDPVPAAPATPFAADPSLTPANWPLADGLHRHLRDALEVAPPDAARVYELLNMNVYPRWNWASGLPHNLDGQGFITALADLRLAMSQNESLRVLVACGIYDIATPWFANRLALDQLHLHPRVAENLTFVTYEGGHMFYTHAGIRARFFDDAQALYAD